MYKYKSIKNFAKGATPNDGKRTKRRKQEMLFNYNEIGVNNYFSTDRVQRCVSSHQIGLHVTSSTVSIHVFRVVGNVTHRFPTFIIIIIIIFLIIIINMIIIIFFFSFTTFYTVKKSNILLKNNHFKLLKIKLYLTYTSVDN